MGNGLNKLFGTDIEAFFDDDQKLETETHGQVLLGLAYLGQGKSQAAAARFKAVLDIDPHNWWAHLHLSNIGI